MGKLTDERFCEMTKDYEMESADLKARVRDAEKAISSHKDADSNSRQFTALIKKYFDVTELDAAMLNMIVEKIVIHERDVLEGERHQRIDIYYNFVGILGDNRHTLYDRRWRESRSDKYPETYNRPTTYKRKTAVSQIIGK